MSRSIPRAPPVRTRHPRPTATTPWVASVRSTQYDGGMGGAPGYNGCSGYGGSGGAATAVEVGSCSSAPTSVGTIVAGGGGGSGGSGQYALVQGQISLSAYVPQSTPTPITYGHPGRLHHQLHVSQHHPEPVPPPRPAPPRGSRGSPCSPSAVARPEATPTSTSTPTRRPARPDVTEAGAPEVGAAPPVVRPGNDQFGSGSSDEWYGQGG